MNDHGDDAQSVFDLLLAQLNLILYEIAQRVELVPEECVQHSLGDFLLLFRWNVPFHLRVVNITVLAPILKKSFFLLTFFSRE